jgi:hypothetical protein
MAVTFVRVCALYYYLVLTNFLTSSRLKFDEYLSKSKIAVRIRGDECGGFEVDETPAFGS